jgi:NhaP-type Na+/H+ or K+/H+ antiporter
MMALLVVFGGAVFSGGLLAALTPAAVIFALAAVFVVRPLCGWVSLLWTHKRWDERAVISFFGIRGLGSAYYLAYAMNRGDFDDPDLLWSTTGLIILISIVLHGATVTPVMRWVDKRSRSIQ